MGQQTMTRRQRTITINGATAFGSKLTEDLGLGAMYRNIMLRLSGTLTYAAAANNAVATLGRGDEWSLIERIDIIANGGDVIRSISGFALRAMQPLLFGTPARAAAQMGDGVTASPAFDSTLIIPFWMFRSYSPMDTILDSSKLGDLRIEITVAASAGINSANGPTNVAATLDVCSYESWGVKGDFSDMRMFPISQNSVGTNPNFQVKITPTAVYRGFIINVASGNTAVSTDDAVNCTNIILQSGNNKFRDLPFAVTRDYYRAVRNFNLDFIQNVAATAPITGGYLNGAKSTRYNADAWTFLDLCEDGYLTEAIDALGFSELNLEFNCTAQVQITVWPIQIFPNRNPKAA